MPRLINYSDRFDGVREAAYFIALRDGVAKITVAAVAAEMQMSTRTVQRLVSSADVLPLLAMQWATDLERRRMLDAPRSGDGRPTRDRLLAGLLDLLPGRPGREDTDVRCAIVGAFETTSTWARNARERDDAVLTEHCDELVREIGVDDPSSESCRLFCLVVGATQQVIRGEATYEDMASMITRHVQLLDQSDAGATTNVDPAA